MSPGTSDEPAGTGVVSVALRLGMLAGPTVFGVTSAGVALPHVAAALHTSLGTVVWVLTAHAFGLGVGTAVAGRIADARGVRTALLAGTVAVCAGTVVCLLAPGLAALVGGRLLLAAGSGAMLASAVTLLAGVQPAQRPRVLAGYGMVLATFAAVATLVGGLVTAWLSWRLTLVLPVLSVAAVPFCRVPERRAASRSPLDGPGAAVLTIAVGALVLLVQARALHLRLPAVITLAAALAVATAVLVWWAIRHPHGFLPRSVVADGTFWTTVVVGVGVVGGLFATMYSVPQILARVHGWGAFTIGAALLPGAAVGAALSRAAGILAERARRRVLVAIAVTSAAGLSAAAGGAAWAAVIAASLALATFAVAQVVLTGIMAARLPLPVRGSGLGLLNLFFFVGGAAGSALAGALTAASGLARPLLAIAAFPLVAAVLAATRLPRSAG
ncbi:MFS transporter [Dactylosporangium cerinum]|uniref:MFS transporter n=1 Tax=Dactylosporangium cerinum TaxID=1434730 RepID=A0ABV9VY48_9ACTN